jgi:hypothetical protein
LGCGEGNLDGGQRTRRCGDAPLNAVVGSGYPYELVGIVYYVFFLMMGRKRYAAGYSNRSRYLVLLAAMVLVGCVPFHYAESAAGIMAMLAAASIALASTLIDVVTGRRKR